MTQSALCFVLFALDDETKRDRSCLCRYGVHHLSRLRLGLRVRILARAPTAPRLGGLLLLALGIRLTIAGLVGSVRFGRLGLLALGRTPGLFRLRQLRTT